MAKVLSVRVDDDLAQWVEGYAARRSVARGVILQAALREFREACEGGVPDLPEPRATGRPPKAASSTVARGVRVDTVSQVHEWALKRQSRLNAAKERSK